MTKSPSSITPKYKPGPKCTSRKTKSPKVVLVKKKKTILSTNIEDNNILITSRGGGGGNEPAIHGETVALNGVKEIVIKNKESEHDATDDLSESIASIIKEDVKIDTEDEYDPLKEEKSASLSPKKSSTEQRTEQKSSKIGPNVTNRNHQSMNHAMSVSKQVKLGPKSVKFNPKLTKTSVPSKDVVVKRVRVEDPGEKEPPQKYTVMDTEAIGAAGVIFTIDEATRKLLLGI